MKRDRARIEHAWDALRSMPRSHSYLVLGVALASGAPMGLLLARAMAAGQVPTPAWVRMDVGLVPMTYAYVTFSTLAVFAVLGYLLGRSFDCVRILSITDSLTGLFNRRYFRQRLAEEMRRARRHGHAMCVLCMDIDHLKAINDRFGHSAGDDALVVVSRILWRNVRSIDAVARVGGDEFAVLLPETSAAQASALSQRILTEVARHVDVGMKLAVSIGSAELDGAESLEADDLLAAADAALYQAKAAGGARAAVARPKPAPLRAAYHTLTKAAWKRFPAAAGRADEAGL